MTSTSPTGTSPTGADVARAFSGHRFDEAFDHLADDVRWVLVGDSVLEGRVAVEAACRGTAVGLAEVTTTWLRLVVADGGDVVAVDAVGRYDSAEGTTAVSSCDVYEFVDGLVSRITSYTVEVDPDVATGG